mmetsp:Transcript_109420/g.294320  ORF Transcript_109420/g.294320 Transcript_109420/m.294320 type:complete len:102 (-) Transcript_109420:55-360(-)
MDDEAVLSEALVALQMDRAQVSAFHVTRWHSTPWARGSYSFSPVGCDCCEIDVLRAAVQDRKFIFAGEHMHEEHQGSLHGAYLSGKDAAQAVFTRRQRVEQ